MTPQRKTRILFDARFATGGAGSGQSTYLNNLLRELSNLDSTSEYALVTPNKEDQPILSSSPNFKFVRIQNLPHFVRKLLPFENIWWRFLVGIWSKFKFKPDIVCSAINVGPLPYQKARYLAVAHDLDYIEYPDLYSAENRLKNTNNTQRSIARADQIISISIATRDQILEKFNYDKTKISVIYHGYDSSRFHSNQSEELLEAIRIKYKLPCKFLFSIGSLSPKKNITLLFKALHQIKTETNETVACVLAGAFNSETKNLLSKELQELGIQDNVTFLGYVPDEDLPLIYQLATMFIFPSIAEGFGLPLVEAMACGCPVVTSNTSCMPEIVNTAALTIDPKNSKELAHNILTLLSSKDEKLRLRELGLKRASKFSWKKTAQETLDILRQLR